MRAIKNSNGFTFTEVMIALSIMALGFLAMAQMQFLSLKQKQDAELGTVATNIIQFMADRDMAEAKRVHLLNSIAYVEAQAGRLNPADDSETHLQYCKSSNSNSICDTCPCNPLKAVTPNPTPNQDGDENDIPETTCAVISTHDFDPENVQFEADQSDCDITNDGELFIVKQVVTTIVNPGETPQISNMNITYGVKTPLQFEDTDYDSVSIKDTIASQEFAISSHREDWSEIIGAGWNAVNIPHMGDAEDDDGEEDFDDEGEYYEDDDEASEEDGEQSFDEWYEDEEGYDDGDQEDYGEDD